MKLDMHGHTYWSKDSQLALADLERAILRAGLDAVCITDHNEIGGALELAGRGKVRVIPGEEVYTSEGEIIGLFLKEKIPARLSPQETIAAIHEQEGIVYIPHPLDRFRGSRLQSAALRTVLDQVDVLEVFNARNLLTGDNTRALQVARQHGLLQGAGSDSHTAHEVGHAYVEIPDFSTPEGLLTALDSAVVHGRRTNPLLHVRTRLDKATKRRSRPASSR
jgi:predicted metal-dependent phosphoesterase TrpH